ncbi:hypothetical protein AB0J86_01040 [Micromonospora sp. NPDC049559]|uniref:hypothetical protein n=1 Tax=Micromonospora sp. NPDC049559 TaxID=3155923 RepID=UPI0034272DEE
MAVIAYLYSRLADRLRQLGREPDRGDNPVPTAVIIVGLAILAAAVVTWAYNTADGFMDRVVPGTPTLQ